MLTASTEMNSTAQGPRCFRLSRIGTGVYFTRPRMAVTQLRLPSSVARLHTSAYTHRSALLFTKINTHAAAASFTKVFRRATGLNWSRPIRAQSKLHRQLTLIIVRCRAIYFSSPANRNT